MEISIAEQTTVFLYSILLGAILAVVYEIIRVLRVIGFNKAIHIIVSDILFMIFCAFITFVFALASSRGHVRFYIYLGEGIGFIFYRYTLGELTSRIYSPIINFFRALFKRISIIFKRITEKLLKTYRCLMYNTIRRKHKSKKQSHS